jgi:hypothetical protein
MLMGSQSLTVSISVYGVRETVAAFDKLPRTARREIAESNLAIAQSLVPRLRFEAATLGGQGPLLGPTVTALRDRRVPVISAGGSTPVGRNRKPAYKLLFGFEFGSDRYGQFRRHLGGGGSYWLFRTVFDNQAEMMRKWFKATDRIIAEWSSNDVGRRA